MDFDYEYASYLDEKGLTEIQALEKEMGTIILAYPGRPVAAQVSKDQIEKIRGLENKPSVR